MKVRDRFVCLQVRLQPEVTSCSSASYLCLLFVCLFCSNIAVTLLFTGYDLIKKTTLNLLDTTFGNVLREIVQI